jgi:hypothetical protein
MKMASSRPKLSFHDLRWFIVISLVVIAFMAWHDITGGRMFATSNQQQWSSSGPGYHK